MAVGKRGGAFWLTRVVPRTFAPSPPITVAAPRRILTGLPSTSRLVLVRTLYTRAALPATLGGENPTELRFVRRELVTRPPLIAQIAHPQYSPRVNFRFPNPPPACAFSVTLALCLASCSSEESPPGATSEAKEGATVTAPQRVLPTNATAVDIVFDLIAAERIVAVPDTVGDYAAVDVDFSTWTEEQVFSEFSAEALLAFNPDLVVVGPWQDPNTVERLVESGVQVVELPRVSGLADIRASIRVAASALQAEAKAEQLIKDFDERLAALRATAQGRGNVGALAYTNYGSGGWAAGAGTTAGLVLELAGLTNVAAEAGREGHDGIDIESLLVLDPDVLVISKPSAGYGATRAYLEGENALSNLSAISGGCIVELPADLFSTASSHLLEAAELLAREIDALVAKGLLQSKVR